MLARIHARRQDRRYMRHASYMPALLLHGHACACVGAYAPHVYAHNGTCIYVFMRATARVALPHPARFTPRKCRRDMDVSAHIGKHGQEQCVCVCVYICMYVCMYVCIYIYVHTCIYI